MLRETLQTELKTATLSQDKMRTQTIRMIISEMKKRDITARGQGKAEASEEELFQMLQSMVKQRRESLAIYVEANRVDLASKEEDEIKIITSFMPAQMSADDVIQAIDKAIEVLGVSSIRDMGKVIKELKERYAGRMDFGQASQYVKERLS